MTNEVTHQTHVSTVVVNKETTDFVIEQVVPVDIPTFPTDETEVIIEENRVEIERIIEPMIEEPTVTEFPNNIVFVPQEAETKLVHMYPQFRDYKLQKTETRNLPHQTEVEMTFLRPDNQY